MLTRGKFKACFARFRRKLQHNSNMRAELILPAQCQRNVEGINITKHYFNTFPDIETRVKITFLSRGECFDQLKRGNTCSPYHNDCKSVPQCQCCDLWSMCIMIFFHSRLTYGDIYRNSFKLVVNGRNAVTLKIRQCLE